MFGFFKKRLPACETCGDRPEELHLGLCRPCFEQRWMRKKINGRIWSAGALHFDLNMEIMQSADDRVYYERKVLEMLYEFPEGSWWCNKCEKELFIPQHITDLKEQRAFLMQPCSTCGEEGFLKHEFPDDIDK